MKPGEAHEQALGEVRLGRKEGTPGTDNNIKFSVSDSAPLIVLFTKREFTVQDSYPVGKTSGKAFDRLRSEGNLWNKDNAFLALFDHLS